mgnify:CR=1 FL=1
MIKKIINFFDRLEDKVRASLSRHPVIYTMVGGVGVVLFWRGVERTADLFSFLNGPVSLIISIFILLITGLFVSFFVGDQLIITGLKGEKKIVEKTESEIRSEASTLDEIKNKLNEIDKEIHEIKK